MKRRVLRAKKKQRSINTRTMQGSHRGVRNQLRSDNLLKNGCFGLQVPDDDAAVERNLRGPAQGHSGRSKDDVTGQVLHDASARDARDKELEYFCRKGV